VHVILDNYSTHKTPAIRRCLAKRPHFHVHFTLIYSSRINLVERWDVTVSPIRSSLHYS